MNGKIIQHIREKIAEQKQLQTEIDELLDLLAIEDDTPDPIPDPIDQFEIVDLVGKLPTNPNSKWFPYTTRNLEALTHHVIHHTAANRDTPPEDIASFHSFRRGWPGAAYTFYISWNGTIYRLNRTETKSFATANMNHVYLSTCLAGSFVDGRKPTEGQLKAANWLHNIYIPSELGRPLPLLGHGQGEGQSTTCPGDTFNEWIGIIESPFNF